MEINAFDQDFMVIFLSNLRTACLPDASMTTKLQFE
jgi:hypothetical protein